MSSGAYATIFLHSRMSYSRRLEETKRRGIAMVVKNKEESLKDILQARPMSKLSDRFYSEDVGGVKGKLVYFNDELFPRLSAVKDEIAKELSLFVDWSGKNAEFDAKRLSQHGRSFFFNHVLVDKEGRVWKYIHVKGGGVSKKNIRDANQPVTSGEELDEAEGLFDIEGAVADKDSSMLFLRNGVKTAAPFMIIEIEEVITKNGERKSIEDLKKKGELHKNIRYDEEILPYRPVLYIRLFSEVMRLEDATKSDYEKFAEEHKMSLKEYRRWWVGREADNIARIHELGKFHNGISDHNLTIDGCIVDNDSVKSISGSDATFFEFTYLLNVIGINMADSSSPEKNNLSKLLLEKYLKGRKNIDRKELYELEARFKRHSSFVGGSVHAELTKMVAREIERRFGNKPEEISGDVAWQ